MKTNLSVVIAPIKVDRAIQRQVNRQQILCLAQVGNEANKKLEMGSGPGWSTLDHD